MRFPLCLDPVIGGDQNPRSGSDPGPGSGGEPARDSAAPAERWVNEHGDALWRFALSRTRSHDAAEEVVQETLLAAVQGFGSFAAGSSVRTWLLGIAVHKIADHFRRSRRRDASAGADPDGAAEDQRFESMFGADGCWARRPGPWGRGADSAAENADLLAALRRCLDGLPPLLAEAVWMRDVLGVPTGEACKAMGVTATNLWTRAHRARAALRLCVEKAVSLRKAGSR